mmetsp:Transcript_32695/g.71772  ORF Transcript_32695/g.71772 Transcript_32695/m.71772 type:complete len:214 (+) Transcript_32695:362-1003(+)
MTAPTAGCCAACGATRARSSCAPTRSSSRPTAASGVRATLPTTARASSAARSTAASRATSTACSARVRASWCLAWAPLLWRTCAPRSSTARRTRRCSAGGAAPSARRSSIGPTSCVAGTPTSSATLRAMPSSLRAGRRRTTMRARRGPNAGPRASSSPTGTRYRRRTSSSSRTTTSSCARPWAWWSGASRASSSPAAASSCTRRCSSSASASR